MSAQPYKRRRRALLIAGALMTMLSVPAVAPPLAGAAPAAVDGSPLELVVFDAGNVQARDETQASDFLYKSATENGGAQFFLGFPEQVRADAAEKVASPDPVTSSSFAYTPVTAPVVTGNGLPATPYTITTVYRVTGIGGNLLDVTQVVTYQNGQQRFNVSYAVKNVSAGAIRFRASAGADLFEGSDNGFGVFDGGPPLLAGGQSAATGRWAGVEQGSPAWSHHQTGAFQGIWDTIGNPAASGLNDTVNDADIDHGAAVQWDNHYVTGLAPNATANYSVAWRTGINGSSATPELSITPAGASQVTGQNHVVTMTADGRAGWPLSNRSVRYTVTGANPSQGTLSTNAFGVTSKALTATNAGTDTITAFVDLNGNTTQDAGEPGDSAQVTWSAAPAGGGSNGPAGGPPPDSDGDGVADAADGCPAFPATTANGCPPAANTAVITAVSSIRKVFKRLGIRRLFRSRAASFTFRAPSAGTLSIRGTANVRGGVASKRVTLLTAKRTFTKAGRGKVKLKLTRAGRRAIKRARRARISLRIVFKNKAGRSYRRSSKLTVNRR